MKKLTNATVASIVVGGIAIVAAALVGGSTHPEYPFWAGVIGGAAGIIIGTTTTR